MHPTERIRKNSEFETALRGESATFRTIKKHNTTTIDSETNKAAGEAKLNSWEATLDDIIHGVDDAGNNGDQIRNTCVRTDYPTITISRKMLTSLIKSEVKSVAQAVWSEDVRSLAKKTDCDVYTTKFGVATDGTNHFYSSWLEKVA